MINDLSARFEKRIRNLRGLFVLLIGAFVLSACGSSAALKSAQTNKTVQQTATKVEQQVSKCMPTTNGTPDPLLLTHHAERAKFAACVGVAKNLKSFEGCAFKVILGGLPTATRVKKGMAACVEQNA